ncbi:MAG: hypothetical protein AB1500_10525 [Bacillota bacterium]
MRLRRLSVGLILAVIAVMLVGCGGGSTSKAPDKEEPKVQDSAPAAGRAEDTGGGGTGSAVESLGEKDFMASGSFADYMHKNFGGSDSPWWYASITDFPEIRTGSKGTVGVLTVHIIPSERGKTDEILSNIASAALTCTDPKIDSVVIVDKNGNTLLQKDK